MPVSKLLVASILGGIALFIWGGLSHMVLGLGEIGIKELPNEEPVLSALKTNIPESGFYFFPGMGRADGMTKEQQQATQDKRMAAGPSGIMIYNPGGELAMSPTKLITELITDIICAFLAGWLLIRAFASLIGFGQRVAFVAVTGLLAGIAVEVPYWNWYCFPTNYMLAAMADQVIGFTLVGMVLAWRLKAANN